MRYLTEYHHFKPDHFLWIEGVSATKPRKFRVEQNTGCSGAQLEGRKMCRRMYATGAARPCGTKEKPAPLVLADSRQAQGAATAGDNAHHISQPR